MFNGPAAMFPGMLLLGAAVWLSQAKQQQQQQQQQQQLA